MAASRSITYCLATLFFILGFLLGCGGGEIPAGNDDETAVNQHQQEDVGNGQDEPDEDIGNGQDEPDEDVGNEQDEPEEDVENGADEPEVDVSGDVVEVLIMFVDKDFAFATPVDIELNGQWHHFFGLEQDAPVWETSLLDARGVVVEVEGPLNTVAFDPDQIRVEGLNIHGYGLFNYVVQKRHPDAEIGQLSQDPDSLEHWATAYDGHQIQWSRLGYSDGEEEVLISNPEFYELELSSSWSDTGKISILIGGRGHHHPAYGPDEHPYDDDPTDPDPEPDPDPDPDPLQHPESPVLVPAQVEVAVTFLNGHFFDVALNGQVFSFSDRALDDPAWDYGFINSLGQNARGQVIELDHELATMAVDPSQIRVEGLNNEGFGNFGYKVVNKDADANLYETNGTHDDNPEFWGNTAADDPLGIIVSRSGNTITGTQYPDPLFYYGLLKQDTGSRVFDSSWSGTGKIGISFLGYGENSEDPAPGLDSPWVEE